MDNLNTFEDFLNAHQELTNQEKAIEADIDMLLKNETKLEEEIKKIHKKIPNINLLSADAKELFNTINFTSCLASNVSSKVKQLDLVKNKVSQCLQRIGDTLDLKYCTQNIEQALNNDDYEVASVHIHRFLSIDESVIRKSANDAINGQVLEGSSLDEAFAKLHEAKHKLKAIVMKKFDEAICDNDTANVERFFKIFPMINQSEEGLKKFSNYLCNKIKGCELSIPGYEKHSNHLNQLSLLFESIAKLIDVHQPLFETYYGPGNLISCIEILQQECDYRVQKIIESFKIKKNLFAICTSVQKWLKSSSSISSNKIEARDIDSLLTEMNLLNSRSETYLKFIYTRAKQDIEAIVEEEGSDIIKEKMKKLDDILKNCQVSLIIQELNGLYVLLEEYFLKESCLKAIQLDDVDTLGSTTSSILDDVFFIVKKCITRALSGGNLDVLCAIINYSVSILDSSFCDAINEKIKYGYPNTGGISGAAAALDLSQAYNVIQAGRYLQTTSDIEKAKLLFLTALNNLDSACYCVKTLNNNTIEQVNKSLGLMNGKQNQEKLDSCLFDLLSVTTKFQSLIYFGINQLFIGLLKPRLKSWIDSFSNDSHQLTDDDILRYEATDGLRSYTQTFLINLDALLKSAKNGLTENNYRSLINVLSTELTKRLENALIKCSFDKLGGYQFDREMRALINYLSSTTTWSVRDKFSRLKQIAIILNFDSVNEIKDFFQLDTNSFKESSSAGISPWYLTPNEVRQILKLRVDFSLEDIKKIKL